MRTTAGVTTPLLPNGLPATPSSAPGNGIYDLAGNVIQDGVNSYVYDAEGRVCAMHGVSGMVGYQYDASGARVSKGSISSMSCDLTTNGYQPWSEYVLGQDGGQMTELAVEQNGTPRWEHTNVTANGSLIATYDTSGLHFYLNDALGTRRADRLRRRSEQTCTSLPFGDALNCSMSNNGPTEHHFTGKERDTESGLDYFGARYYGSNMGRWMSPDWAIKAEPVPYSDLANPQSLNLYGYVGKQSLVSRRCGWTLRPEWTELLRMDHVVGAVAGVVNLLPQSANFINSGGNAVLTIFTSYRVAALAEQTPPACYLILPK